MNFVRNRATLSGEVYAGKSSLSPEETLASSNRIVPFPFMKCLSRRSSSSPHRQHFMASPASSWVVLRRICWRSLSQSLYITSIIDIVCLEPPPEYPIHRCCPTMWCRQTPPPGTWRRGSTTWRNLWSSSCYLFSWRSSPKSSGCLERRSL